MGALNWVLFAILVLYVCSMLILFVWGIYTSVKTKELFRQDPVWPSSPASWTFESFAVIFNNFAVPVTSVNGTRSVWLEELLLNTVLYAGGGAILQTIVPCFVAYLTAKFRFKFSGIVYWIVVTAMMIPLVGSDASMLQLMHSLNLYDTWFGAWIQKFSFLGMYYLVFYAMFRSIPNDYAEAAEIDGAGEVRKFISIMLPMVMGTFWTVFLIKFIEFYNDYQVPLLYIPTHPTLAYGVYYIANSTEDAFSTVPARMANCILVLVPTLVLFCIFRDRLMDKVSMGGIKE